MVMMFGRIRIVRSFIIIFRRREGCDQVKKVNNDYYIKFFRSGSRFCVFQWHYIQHTLFKRDLAVDIIGLKKSAVFEEF